MSGGNDIPVLASSATAERVEGGYRFSGHKIFGSLPPVWTRLGIHAMDLSDPARPMVVHAFMPRDTNGYRIVETWDTLAMRAMRSEDRILLGAVVPDRFIARVVPSGFVGADSFVLGIFAWAEPTFEYIHTAIAQRVRDLWSRLSGFESLPPSHSLASQLVRGCEADSVTSRCTSAQRVSPRFIANGERIPASQPKRNIAARAFRVYSALRTRIDQDTRMGTA